ncbi:MAG: hypothetical protein JO142_07040 [Burkholderiales bacterium]|nr:hypothetical protein [Burkholderiales bacterium]
MGLIEQILHGIRPYGPPLICTVTARAGTTIAKWAEERIVLVYFARSTERHCDALLIRHAKRTARIGVNCGNRSLRRCKLRRLHATLFWLLGRIARHATALITGSQKQGSHDRTGHDTQSTHTNDIHTPPQSGSHAFKTNADYMYMPYKYDERVIF